MTDFFIDLHCHPSLKPYGKSFALDPAGQNNTSRILNNSIWHYNPPNIIDRGVQLLTGVAKFTQADCTTLAYGNVRLICASLYPIEKGFFNNDLKTGHLSDLADNFVSSVGFERVNMVQEVKNYFEDLVREYRYYQQLSGQLVQTDMGAFKYRLVKNYDDIENFLGQPGEDTTIFIILSIEGMHVLQSDASKEPEETTVLENVKEIKNWPHAPFFVTFAHHFYNHLCGHAKSLTGLVGNVTDQSEGQDTGFTELGKKVVHRLLRKENEKRIFIDIKHMSALTRKQYFEILATDFAGENIPVIASHAAANGLRSADEPVADGKETANKLLARDINLYDNEILSIALTNGICGLQLDERRIASEAALKNIKHSLFMNKIRHYRSELLWNQVQHIVELLDRNGLFAWDCMAIGSDFDGIINPLNGFLTHENTGSLQEYLERYAFNYMNERGKQVLKTFNQISAGEIVSRVFQTNALQFIKRWFV